MEKNQKLPPARALKFAHAYWKTGCGAEAARQAGYKGSADSLKRMATRILGRADVQAEIERLRAESAAQAVVGRSEALTRWSEQVIFDVGPFIKRITETELDGEGNEREVQRLALDLEAMVSAGKGHLISSVELKPDGTVRVKFPDRQRALQELARLEGWYSSERHEVHHTVGDLGKLSDAELVAKCKELGIEPEGNGNDKA